MNNRITTNATCAAAIVLSGCCNLCCNEPPVRPCSASVDFESPLAAGTTYGTPTHAPGAVIYANVGVAMSVESFLHPSGNTSFNQASITAPAPGALSSQSLAVNNINLRFIFLPQVREITLDFVDFGGHENFSVNRSTLDTRELTALPAVVNGVNVTVTSTPIVNAGGVQIGKQGKLHMQGQIGEFVVGGQEFAIDNVCGVK